MSQHSHSNPEAVFWVHLYNSQHRQSLPKTQLLIRTFGKIHVQMALKLASAIVEKLSLAAGKVYETMTVSSHSFRQLEVSISLPTRATLIMSSNPLLITDQWKPQTYMLTSPASTKRDVKQLHVR